MNFCASILVYEKADQLVFRTLEQETGEMQFFCENGKDFLPIPLSYVQNTDILVFIKGMESGMAEIARPEFCAFNDRPSGRRSHANFGTTAPRDRAGLCSAHDSG